ncbi:MAG: hypothetical protein M3Q65_02340 [Chloroflexota bacterium]|nr:hypothetical protein [Chloroflexota bacterium]
MTAPTGRPTRKCGQTWLVAGTRTPERAKAFLSRSSLAAARSFSRPGQTV